MKLSILIPVYNYPITPLVEVLIQQCIATHESFEIVCADDASSNEIRQQNAGIQNRPEVIWHQLDENVGRSAIRNKLADWASGDLLIFLDCDSMPESDNFIALYRRAYDPQKVIYGGRSYAPTPPRDDTWFRWHYGVKREVKSIESRTENPYISFLTNNFAIPSSIFKIIRFDEEIRGYGHEDTRFAQDLRKQGVVITHIDNPVRHVGLELKNEFIAKTKTGVENLAILVAKGALSDEVRLVSVYHTLLRLKISWILTLCDFFISSLTLTYLYRRDKPALRIFDFYKLLCFHRKHKQCTR